MTLQAPSVSMHSNFFTKQFFLAMLFAVRLMQAVRQIGRPSGTLAMTIAMKKVKLLKKLYPMTKDKMKNKVPKHTAMMVTILTKRLISLWINVSVFFRAEVRPAILPKLAIFNKYEFCKVY